ncbi:MAG: Hsp70 family protein [Caldilineaceae bacterium]
MSNLSDTPIHSPTEHHFVIGIDLGTTNSAAAYVDLTNTDQRTIQIFDIPQFVAERQMGPRRMLPSFLYLPGAYDLPPGSTALPWDAERNYIVGEFAREQGALARRSLGLIGQIVALSRRGGSHGGYSALGAAGEVSKVSPVEASARYLRHIREAWNAEMAADEEEATAAAPSDFASDDAPLSRRFEDQLIVLTVPASFDEVARELTLAAAQDAGMPNVVLLEEPLAAFYAWLSAHEQSWRQQMQDGQLILVCDVGGGTSDFSIVGIRAGAAGLRFDRLAVGEHLLLGGDNMDLTLGRHIEAKLMGQLGKLDAQRWHQLVYQCRQAKETLLTRRERPQQEITILGAAGQLIGGTRKTSLTQEEVQQLILEGFFRKSMPMSALPVSAAG